MFVTAVCDSYETPQDVCVSPFIDLFNNFVEFKCLDNCDPSCQRTYIKCNHATHKFQNVQFSHCVAGMYYTDKIIAYLHTMNYYMHTIKTLQQIILLIVVSLPSPTMDSVKLFLVPQERPALLWNFLVRTVPVLLETQ